MQLAMHDAVELQPLLRHHRVIAAQEKMHIQAGTGQQHAVITANRPGTNDADPRRAFFNHQGSSSAGCCHCTASALTSESPRSSARTSPKK